ncbi:MAG: hypothetical protein JO053_04380 [Acidobacteria bacterium]|nr:hypothetical protein [Acidobacteriota bacterium]
MESIYSKNGEELFPKETPIYGRVTLRRHRHFPLVSGKLEVVLEPLLTWNGQPVEIGIARSGKMKAALGSNRNVNRACGDPGSDCVAGRRNANVAAAVPAIAGAGTAAVASAVNDTNTKFIIVSSFFSVAKDVAELLNGTDAAIEAGEIFDLHVSAETTVCPVPKPPHDGQMPGKK